MVLVGSHFPLVLTSFVEIELSYEVGINPKGIRKI